MTLAVTISIFILCAFLGWLLGTRDERGEAANPGQEVRNSLQLRICELEADVERLTEERNRWRKWAMEAKDQAEAIERRAFDGASYVRELKS